MGGQTHSTPPENEEIKDQQEAEETVITKEEAAPIEDSTIEKVEETATEEASTEEVIE